MDKLEGFSLAGLFYSVLGTKEERLKQERQELLAAKLNSDETVNAVQYAENEVHRLEAELAPFQSDETDFERLLDEKERWLSGVRPATAGRSVSQSAP